MEITRAFVVKGDFGNIGDGSVIGIFLDLESAKVAAKDRGSFDCGGNGRIEEKTVITDGEKVFILANTVLIPKEKGEEQLCPNNLVDF